jgi:iron complex transport system permease protein
VEPVKNLIILLVAMAAGASVAVTGMIGFVGLIVPHLIRLVAGPDYRRLLPASDLLNLTGSLPGLAFTDVSGTNVVSPEPGMPLLMASGLAAVWFYRRTSRRKLAV